MYYLHPLKDIHNHRRILFQKAAKTNRDANLLKSESRTPFPRFMLENLRVTLAFLLNNNSMKEFLFFIFKSNIFYAKSNPF